MWAKILALLEKADISPIMARSLIEDMEALVAAGEATEEAIAGLLVTAGLAEIEADALAMAIMAIIAA